MAEQTQQPQPQMPDVDLTFKLSFIQQIVQALDEAPHRYVRGVIDALTQNANQQLQALQQSAPIPPGNTQ